MSAPAAKTLRVVVLISGGGTTLRNLLEQIERRGLPLQVVGVISSNPKARGLEYAKAAGIATSVHERRASPPTMRTVKRSSTTSGASAATLS